MNKLIKHNAWIIALAFTAARFMQAQATLPTSAEDSVRSAEYARKQALLTADTVLLSRLTGAEFYETRPSTALQSLDDSANRSAGVDGAGA